MASEQRRGGDFHRHLACKVLKNKYKKRPQMGAFFVEKKPGLFAMVQGLQ